MKKRILSLLLALALVLTGVPMAFATESGFADGNGDGTFAPKAFATRAEAAKLIYKIFG